MPTAGARRAPTKRTPVIGHAPSLSVTETPILEVHSSPEPERYPRTLDVRNQWADAKSTACNLADALGHVQSFLGRRPACESLFQEHLSHVRNLLKQVQRVVKLTVFNRTAHPRTYDPAECRKAATELRQLLREARRRRPGRT